jgi:signal transduction histidine kinase
MLTDVGKEQMEALRQVSERLLADETSKVTIERKAISDTLLLNRLGVATMTAISLLALAMYLRQTTALDAQQRQQALAIQRERDVLEAEVARRTTELTQLAQYLETAREDERSRLARELHDELGALLTAAKLDAARIKSRLGTLAPEANERLAHLNETLNSGIALKRRIIEDLRPSSLSNLGLIAALEIQAREFSERSAIQVKTCLEPVALSPAAELTVYRLVQEAFTNIAKYAKATQVEVGLADGGDFAEVYVRDNGIGFDLRASAPSAHGLLGMRYRVNAEGGQLRIESKPGDGTRIMAALPKLRAAA